MDTSLFWILSGTFLFYLNSIASFHLFRNKGYGRWQKLFQAVLVWLTPVFGAIVIMRATLADKEYLKELRKKKWAAATLGQLFTLTLLAADGSEAPGEGGYGGGCGGCGGSC